jgi:hypothetical protein
VSVSPQWPVDADAAGVGVAQPAGSSLRKPWFTRRCEEAGPNLGRIARLCRDPLALIVGAAGLQYATHLPLRCLFIARVVTCEALWATIVQTAT